MSLSEASRATAAPAALGPFRHRVFALLWIATVASNVGTWMHEVGAGWLMTELSSSPLLVAAVQAMTTLPVFLFALLAGAVADTVDRRKLLIAVNVVMGLVAMVMAVLVHRGVMTPPLLLAFTFVLGTGAALIAPAWQAVIPRLVPRDDLPAAIALNSMGINVSRAIGPALAALLIVSAGIASPFALNALSVLGIIAVLWWWRPDPPAADTLPPEPIGTALRAGLRYVINSAPVKAALLRAVAFFTFASAFWAMLPIVARETLSGGPTEYGFLLASVGAGAVLGAFLIPGIKRRLGVDGTISAGALGTACVLMILGLSDSKPLAMLAALLAGVSWIAVLSTLNVAVQTALPDWVRARGLSIFLTVFFGSMSAGSLLWGQVASMWGISAALLAAATGMVVFIPAVRSARLGTSVGLDLSPSMHWPEPVLTPGAPPDGPVMISIEYRVGGASAPPFQAAMAELAQSRRRAGGYRWSLMRDAADPERYVESWWEPSWLDHQRHHQRVTHQDRKLQEHVATLLEPGTGPLVSHLVTWSSSDERDTEHAPVPGHPREPVG